MATKRQGRLVRKPTQERSRETVKAIVQAGERVLLQEGRDAFTTNRVAVVAGVSKGTLYEYFSSTEELLRAVEEHSWSKVVEQITLAFSGTPAPSPEEGVARLVQASMDAIARRLAMHGLTLDTMAEDAADRQRMLAAFARAGVARLEAVTSRERLRPKDLELAAEIVVCLVPFLSWLESRVYTEPARSKAFREEVVTLVTSFLLRDAPQREA